MRRKNTRRELGNDEKRGNRRGKREKEEKQNLRRGRQFSGANNVTAEKRGERNEVEKYEEHKTIKKRK